MGFINSLHRALTNSVTSPFFKNNKGSNSFKHLKKIKSDISNIQSLSNTSKFSQFSDTDYCKADNFFFTRRARVTE